MSRITINGVTYSPLDTVPWPDAIAEGGFYYDRARYLGLPCPAAILFDERAPGHLAAMGRYHAMFRNAEANRIAADPHWG